METLGQRIKFARTQAKLKQHEVAAHFGIDRVNISQWESDTTKPDIDRLPALAKLLNTTVEWLIHEAGSPPAQVDEEPFRKPQLVSSFDPDDFDNACGSYAREHWKPKTKG